MALQPDWVFEIEKKIDESQNDIRLIWIIFRWQLEFEVYKHLCPEIKLDLVGNSVSYFIRNVWNFVVVFQRPSQNWFSDRLSKGAKLTTEVGAQLKIFFSKQQSDWMRIVYASRFVYPFKLRRNLFTLTISTTKFTAESSRWNIVSGQQRKSLCCVEDVLSMRARNQNIGFVSNNFFLCILFDQTWDFIHHWDTFFFSKKLPVVSVLDSSKIIFKKVMFHSKCEVRISLVKTDFP